MEFDEQLIPQMSLGLSLNNGFQFSNFFATESTLLLLAALKNIAEQPSDDFILVSGSEQSGKTHLLLATYHRAQQFQINSGYLPLEEFVQYSPEDSLTIYADTSLLLIDGVEHVANDKEWQKALFDLYNRRKDAGLATVFTIRSSIVLFEGIQLNDLKTRLIACLNFQIPEFSDKELVAFLEFAASARGLILNQQCMQFIILRAGRSQQSLFNIVEQLDRAQLSVGRRITVPFIKALFHW